jgi:hypothetical protein
MTPITSQELAQYRSQLAYYDDALIALDEIENCEGDLEDAAINLAIQIGQQPDRSDWLDGLAKRCRVAVCQADLKADLLQNKLSTTVDYLRQEKICPVILITPIVIYVIKQGVNEFCAPLSFQL